MGIANSHDYDDGIRAMALDEKGVALICDALRRQDVQSAAYRDHGEPNARLEENE